MEASEDDRMPDAEVLGQVVSHFRKVWFLLTRYFFIDVVCFLYYLPEGPRNVRIFSSGL